MKIEGSWASAGGFRRECNTAAATRASGIDTRADTFTQAGRGAPSALAPPDRRAEKSFRRAHGGRSGEADTTGLPARVRTGPSVPASDQGVLGFAPDWPGVEGIQERADGGLPFHCGGGPGISPRRCAGERGRRPRAARESTLLPQSFSPLGLTVLELDVGDLAEDREAVLTGFKRRTSSRATCREARECGEITRTTAWVFVIDRAPRLNEVGGPREAVEPVTPRPLLEAKGDLESEVRVCFDVADEDVVHRLRKATLTDGHRHPRPPLMSSSLAEAFQAHGDERDT